MNITTIILTMNINKSLVFELNNLNTPGLTKENFFDKFEGRFPLMAKQFYGFIDELKSIMDWNTIFNATPSMINGQTFNPNAPKFHELPFLFQNSIIDLYFLYLLMVFQTSKDREIKIFFNSNASPFHESVDTLEDKILNLGSIYEPILSIENTSKA